MRLRPATFRGRIVLATTAITAMVMAIAAAGLILVLDVSTSRDADAVLAHRADAVADRVADASARGVQVPPGVLDPGEGVYDATAAPVAVSLAAADRKAADDLAAEVARSGGARTEDVGERVRLRAEAFTSPEGGRWIVVVSQDVAPYETTERYALLATMVLGVLAAAVAGLVADRVTRRALAPVRRMAEQAAEWSEQDLARRFRLGRPVDEIAALGRTLDRLLDRVATVIHNEQRLTDELAHELRTPLTVIQGSADLARLRGVSDPDLARDLAQIEDSARQLGSALTALLDIARERTSLAGGTCSVGELLDGVRSLVPGHVRLITDADAATTVRLAAPLALAVRALAPGVENAARHARTQVRLHLESHDDVARLSVLDDGEGLGSGAPADPFAAGASGASRTGLGLSIARRVARSLGGDVELADAPAGGAAFVLVLPRA